MDDVLSAGPVAPASACSAGQLLGHALAEAHARGVLHRDIKPANILIDRYGEPTLSDFGISSLNDVAASVSVQAFTAEHAAPELFDEGRSTAASDVYSLASTIYTMLEGRAPFERTPGRGPARVHAQGQGLPVRAQQCRGAGLAGPGCPHTGRPCEAPRGSACTRRAGRGPRAVGDPGGVQRGRRCPTAIGSRRRGGDRSAAFGPPGHAAGEAQPCGARNCGGAGPGPARRRRMDGDPRWFRGRGCGGRHDDDRGAGQRRLGQRYDAAAAQVRRRRQRRAGHRHGLTDTSAELRDRIDVFAEVSDVPRGEVRPAGRPAHSSDLKFGELPARMDYVATNKIPDRRVPQDLPGRHRRRGRSRRRCGSRTTGSQLVLVTAVQLDTERPGPAVLLVDGAVPRRAGRGLLGMAREPHRGQPRPI